MAKPMANGETPWDEMGTVLQRPGPQLSLHVP